MQNAATLPAAPGTPSLLGASLGFLTTTTLLTALLVLLGCA